MIKPWYSFSIDEIFSDLGTKRLGLSSAEAKQRLQQYGYNTLPDEKRQSLFSIFLQQFKSPLIYTLIVASIIVFLMGELTDAIIILSVLVFNAIVGTIQEGRAQHTLRALKQFTETTATVIRDGNEIIIPDRDVVVGDIILVQEGEKIPADARIIESHNLKIDESSFTGESEPVTKTQDIIERENVTTADQNNMVFKGTHSVSGNGIAIVVATGIQTVVGTIAEKILTVESEIPLKANIRHLSKLIVGTVIVISLVLFAIGLIKGQPITTMFTTVVSLAVSIIPEGLPIVMTLVLATGVWRMSKRNALVKKLQAVEALGQARIIAVDKTGTITKNELVIKKVWTDNQLFEVQGLGYEPKGKVFFETKEVDSAEYISLQYLGKLSASIAHARIAFSQEDTRWHISGDPTEAAMVAFAGKLGFDKNAFESQFPLRDEVPFDYRLKYHATLRTLDSKNTLAIAGAPEVILSLCTTILRNGKRYKISQKIKDNLLVVFSDMSAQGLRVIAIADRISTSDAIGSGSVQSMTFVGFLGMQDTLRPEVNDAMQRAHQAGIKVVMITGDHAITAQAIALQAGIYVDGDELLTGNDIDVLSDSQLSEKLDRTSVFARVTPDHKLRIVNAYKKRGEIIAMTGDGVNDAPSLVAADLGVAMGKIGTEVAKEASDIVLLDDNFGSIISAVEEGRSIYKTIKKVTLYLFSTSFGEVLVITGALLIGLPLPILAAQIIWLNLVTDGFLDVALAMEPKEKGLLREKFKRPNRYLVDSMMLQRMVVMAVPMMVGTLYLFSNYFEGDIAKAWTISLTVLAAFQWFNAWNCRSDRVSIFKMNPFSNKYLIGATLLIIILHIGAIYTPFMQKILQTVPLGLSEWLVIIPIAASIVVVEEIRKLIYRKRLQVQVV